ncbi:MAG: hypothetical protein PHV20_09105 [Bacteroidales bacterium]|nr:hypothetical protein [Bacteroidales bacterium]
METINEYNMVHRELKHKQLDTREVAARLGLKYQTAYSLMQRQNYTVHEMARFSKLCEYNFFAELATQYNYAEPADAEKTVLQDRIKELETEIAVLRRTFKDLMGK